MSSSNFDPTLEDEAQIYKSKGLPKFFFLVRPSTFLSVAPPPKGLSQGFLSHSSFDISPWPPPSQVFLCPPPPSLSALFLRVCRMPPLKVSQFFHFSICRSIFVHIFFIESSCVFYFLFPVSCLSFPVLRFLSSFSVSRFLFVILLLIIRSVVECFGCGRPGHRLRECPQSPEGQAVISLARYVGGLHRTYLLFCL